MTTVMIPAPVGEILKTLEAAGYGAWCVGGCVRDALLDRMPGDWDVTTSARPEETMALFAGRAVPTGLRHGTVTVKTEQGGVEITTLRRDGAYRDHRRPETVTFTDSLEEDLRRRDFTINAMAADLQGTLYDPLGGRADLTTKVLRCVGEPDRRFGEDALRILRGPAERPPLLRCVGAHPPCHGESETGAGAAADHTASRYWKAKLLYSGWAGLQTLLRPSGGERPHGGGHAGSPPGRDGSPGDGGTAGGLA